MPEHPKNVARRQAELRARRKAAGGVFMGRWVSPEAVQALKGYKTRQGYKTLDEALEALLQGLNGPPHPQAAPAAPAGAWEAFTAAYQQILADERRGWATAALIALLEPVAAAFEDTGGGLPHHTTPARPPVPAVRAAPPVIRPMEGAPLAPAEPPRPRFVPVEPPSLERLAQFEVYLEGQKRPVGVVWQVALGGRRSCWKGRAAGRLWEYIGPTRQAVTDQIVCGATR